MAKEISFFSYKKNEAHQPPHTFAARLAPDNRPSGFDYLRLLLSFAIMVDHSVIACLGDQAQNQLFTNIFRPAVASLVPMFFALSGFLVASSLIRSRTLIVFVLLRILRIVPALAVDTLFCALFLGVIFTAMPLKQYFLDRSLWSYFLNITGMIHYYLPGVFENNPSNVVNTQLWTIPFELKCYATLTVMGLFKLHRWPLIFGFFTLAATIATAIYVFWNPVSVIDVWHLLLPSFLWGVVFYLYADRIEWSARLMSIALLSAILLLQQTSALTTFAAVPVAYVTVWLGLLRPPRGWLIRSGDYSYPLYLYSFPIQQAIIVAVPFGRIWWINLIVAIPIGFGLAFFSWHCVEHPAQSLRPYIFKAGAWVQEQAGRFGLAKIRQRRAEKLRRC